jgi:hypothetical protein
VMLSKSNYRRKEIAAFKGDFRAATVSPGGGVSIRQGHPQTFAVAEG